MQNNKNKHTNNDDAKNKLRKINIIRTIQRIIRRKTRTTNNKHKNNKGETQVEGESEEDT